MIILKGQRLKSQFKFGGDTPFEDTRANFLL